ncbi:hypothetical protein [Symbioplanes lichenis]|uniref:hypothetical protein n=1 Tax=Symbioplanes lichenis TaxID=1629072 RepID=UPI0027388255|nr:hypothetical protein [Actinoplanes lichenis]
MSSEDRIEALAAALVRAAATGRVFPVEGPPGPPGPACVTAAALAERMLTDVERAEKAGRPLETYLRALLHAAGPLAVCPSLDLDTVAALYAAAATAEPPALPPSWRRAAYPENDEASYADWRSLLLSQLADLADLQELGAYASLGTRIPRPAGAVRATGEWWYNFHPASYVEAGLTHPAALTNRTELTWADLCALAVLGQIYE